MNKKLVKSYAAKLSDERGNPVSPKEAEDEIVRILYHAAHVLAPKYRFGYHSIEDIEHEGIESALKVLETEKYDISRPLENFIYSHMHNQLYNFRRKHYQRLEAPCKCCDPFDPPAYPCVKFRDWKSRNSVKQNLMQALDMSNISDEAEVNMRDDSDVIHDSIGTELRTLLDRELPTEFRRDYLQMLDGKTIPKCRRDKIREAVLLITKEKGYLDPDEVNAYQEN